jgi:beta-glucosidase
VADVLFGDVNPSGKLPLTWPRATGQLPLYYNRLPTGRPTKPENRFTLQYIDEAITPLYPFGWGLSYTRFRFARLRTDRPTLARDGRIDVAIDVTNTGRVAGDAVPQIYVRYPNSRVARPALQLAGFNRVHLEPGETRTVHVPLKATQLAYWDQGRKALVVEPGTVQLMAGSSSADIGLRQDIEVR